MQLFRRGDRIVLQRPEYYVQTGSMFENPHGVPPAEIVRMIVENPPEVTAQVVFGKYVEASGLVFNADLIQRLFDRQAALYPELRGQDFIVRGGSWAYKRAIKEAAEMFARQSYRQNNRFYTGVDYARLTDYTVIFTIDTIRLPAKVVYYRRLNRVNWDSIYAEVGRAAHLFGPNIIGDSTGMGGDVVLDALQNRLYCPKHHAAVLSNSRCLEDDGSPKDCRKEDYISLGCVQGYDFSPVGQSSRKKQLVDHLRNCLAVGYSSLGRDGDFGWLRCPPIPQLEEEMTFYSWDDKGLETDAMFALALASWHGLKNPVGDASLGSPFGG